MSTHPCHQCGTAVDDGAAFCSRCGAHTIAPGQPLPPPPPPSPPPPSAPPPSAPPAAGVPVASVQPTVPPPAGPKKKNPAVWVISTAIVVVAALVVGWLALRGDDKSNSGNAAEIFLEPAVAAGTDPFTPTVDTNTAPPPIRLDRTTPLPGVTTTTVAAATTVPASTAPVPSSTTPTATTVAALAPTAVRGVDATAPGLYGGTRNNAACDREKMITFLMANADKGAAWAGAQGITVDQIPSFIRSLTPFVLRADTRVTNFGFKNGHATKKQSVLQMGTAVLVDEYGIPRARCSCGNPLAPPEPQPTGNTYVGDPWPGFDPMTVIVVVNVNNVVINDFVVVDLNGGYFGRPGSKGAPDGITTDGPVYVDTLCDMVPDAPECLPPVESTTTTLPEPVLGTGDIQFTLRWSSTADLDLAVLDPNGEEINFDVRTSSSGGQLDVDSNAMCEGTVTNPVENVFWPVGQSPEGVYKVAVRYYSECPGGNGPQPFTLTALVGGVEVELQPVTGGLRSLATDQLGAPGEQRLFQVDKTAAPPIATTPPVTEPTVPATTTPADRVPVSTLPPAAPPTTATPGATMSLEDYCAQLYPPPEIGPGNPNYTLCMHDPTVA